jgi:predicted Fe-Mo cluster-binding NifX family protein
MKIALPTSDRLTVFKRTGRTTEFAIFEIVDGSYEFVEFRANPHTNHTHGDHEHHHKDVVAILNDCDALLVSKVGDAFKNDFNQAGISIYKTNQEKLKDAVSVFTWNMLDHVRL